MFSAGVDVLARLGQALWPPRCVLCSGPGVARMDLCAGCEADLPLNRHACEHCAEPMSRELPQPALCGACLRRPPRFDACVAPFIYEFPVDRMIQKLKYGHELQFGHVLGQLLAQRLACRGSRPELVIPVPLASRRFRERGFNQARELALPLCRSLNLTLRSDLVVRRRETKEQAGLDKKERTRNTRDAFALAKPLHAKHVAIIDDVVTTGSTANALARVLRLAGAEWIEVWAVARATRK